MQKLIHLLRSCHFPALMLLGAAPLGIVLVCLWDSALLDAAGMLYAAAVALSLLCVAVPGKRRLQAAALCIAVLIAFAAGILPLQQRPSLLLLPLGAGALLLSALPLASRRLGELPPVFYAGGILAYLFLHFTYLSNPPPGTNMTAVTALFILYMVLFVLALNRISLDNATLARHAATRSMHAVNTLLALALFALALLLSSMPAIIRFVESAWLTLRAVMGRIVLFLLNLLPAAGDPGMQMQPAAPLSMPATEQTAPGPLSVILEYVSTALTVLVVVVGLLALLRLIAAGLARLMRHLAKRLRLFAANATEDYIDEISDTREDGTRRSRSERLRARRRTRATADTPADRIRLRYARLLSRHPQWSQSSTARENLPDDPASIYERVRYSDHPVTPQDAEQFDQNVRRI